MQIFHKFQPPVISKNICLSLLYSYINIRLNNTAVTSLFHGQKVNNKHAIQHTVHRNFWPMALEKPTRGKLFRKRESFYYASGKNQTFVYSKKSNLSQPRKMTQQSVSVFVLFFASISMQILLGKCARNISKNLPSKTVPTPSKSVLYRQHLMLSQILISVSTKKKLPREMWCTSLEICTCFFRGNRAQNRTV